MAVGDVILTDPDENGKRDRWTQVPLSPVGEQAFNEYKADPDTICLICKAPAVSKALFTFQVDGSKEEGNERIRGHYRWPTRTPDGEEEDTEENREITKAERIAVMHVCEQHRGQWVLEELHRGYLWSQNWAMN